MPQVIPGQLVWWGERDSEGHRIYHVKWLIRAFNTDGPANVMQSGGLYQPGDVWAIDNDVDIYAWCRPDMTVRLHQHNEGEPHIWWTAEQLFSTKPPSFNSQRCNDTQIEDPILEPPKISIGFNKVTEEITHDRFGVAITSSSWEQLRGPQLEFEFSFPTIRIEQNVATFFQAYTLPALMIDTVNIDTIWGLSRRTARLANFTAEKLYYGQCYAYYKRVLEFETNPNTFDRDLLDEGNKVLFGEWSAEGFWDVLDINGVPANPYNPSHFDKAKDRSGNPIKVVLNGKGVPASVMVSTAQKFMALQGGAGAPLYDSEFWIPLASTTATEPEMFDLRGAQRGQIFDFGSDLYVCLVNRPNTLFPILGDDANEWALIGPGPVEDALREMGYYDPATVYATGDLVRQLHPTGAAYRNVQRYGESDFLELGIPTDL